MAGVDSVHPQFFQAVGIVVACIAFEVHRVANGHALEAPLIALATLLDVCHQLILLDVLVSLAVQLKVGLELCGVVAQLALVRVAHHRSPLFLWERTLGTHVQAQHVQVVGSEVVAHGALEEFEGGVAGLG